MAAIQEVSSTKVTKTERVTKKSVFIQELQDDDDATKVKLTPDMKKDIKEQPAFRMEQIAIAPLQHVLRSLGRAHIDQVSHELLWTQTNMS